MPKCDITNSEGLCLLSLLIFVGLGVFTDSEKVVECNVAEVCQMLLFVGCFGALFEGIGDQVCHHRDRHCEFGSCGWVILFIAPDHALDWKDPLF